MLSQFPGAVDRPGRPLDRTRPAPVPQDGHRYEIVDGSLHVTPPPDGTHDRWSRRSSTTLRGGGARRLVGVRPARHRDRREQPGART